ncbi:MAG: hypothetical protein RXR41_05760 [Candidatus Marsarchaeota archaeon]
MRDGVRPPDYKGMMGAPSMKQEPLIPRGGEDVSIVTAMVLGELLRGLPSQIANWLCNCRCS